MSVTNRINYRVVWQDRYRHVSATVTSYEDAELFVSMLGGVAYTSQIQTKDPSGEWTSLGRRYPDAVPETGDYAPLIA